jgi:hypothetical protein
MKKSIALSALLVLFTASVFAAAPTSKISSNPSTDAINIVSLHSDLGVGVTVQKEEAGKTFVTVYNSHNEMVFKDLLSRGQFAQKGYILSGLDNGDYTFKVTNNDQQVSKKVHIFDEYGQKTYIILE